MDKRGIIHNEANKESDYHKEGEGKENVFAADLIPETKETTKKYPEGN